MTEKTYDVTIVGGSAAGISAALTLGRSLRTVIVIDSGTPCNIQTPHSHNFMTNDGVPPTDIATKAKAEASKYQTVIFEEDTVTDIQPYNGGFVSITSSGKRFYSKKILLATGLRDRMPDIKGFRECWGISVLHCPYCHGYEVRGEETAILANGEAAYHLGVLINHWTQKITILTNGISELRNEEKEKLTALGISVIENEIDGISHHNGQLTDIRFNDGTTFKAKAMYASIPFKQQSPLAENLGCKMSSHGHVDVDCDQRTSVEGVYAAGDCTAQHRAISIASASGTRAGFTINAELILKD